jgi:hypothetical protein
VWATARPLEEGDFAHGYDKGAYLEDQTDEVIEVITEHAPRKNSPLSVLLFYRPDGAYSEVDEDDTAFGGGRSPRSMGFFVGLCPHPSCSRQNGSGCARCGTRCARTRGGSAT